MDPTMMDIHIAPSRTHSQLDLAEFAAKKLIEIASCSPTYMHLKTSWTEVGKKVNVFTSGGIGIHPEQESIMKILDELDGLLREAGYNPDCSNALHDVDVEEKVDNLRYHSERLAVAYALLKLPEGVPIRVMKNLRVCRDCHAVIKIISKVKEREIIVRDTNRFHHFKNGECSCKDYW